MKSILKFTWRGLGLIVVLLAIGYTALLARNNQRGYTIDLDQVASTGAEHRTGLVDIGLALFLQVRAEALNTPASPDSTPLDFEVEAGATAASVAQKLQALGLIDDPLLFQLFLRYHGLDTSLEAGHYLLRRNLTLKELSLALQEGRPQEVVITIPEGWRAEQVAELLSREQLMDSAAFLEVVRQGTAVDHPLLADRPLDQGYEGYLYPDTYRLPLDTTPADLIRLMLDTLAEKLPADPFSLAATQGLTLYQTLILASIVEREAVVAEERPVIASVYLNRLGPDSPRQLLEADPTVQYAMGYQPDTGQWWKTPVTLEEYAQVDSPYNTYLYPGLPPGPIANPGRESIIAVLEPAQTNYYFFVCRQPGCAGGEHVFAATYEEHLRNVDHYYGR